MASFDAMYRLCKRMSAALPKLDTVPVDSFDRRCLPVDLSLSEALMLVDVIIYRAELTRGVDLTVEKGKFEPTEVRLVFAPFHPESYFYVDSVLNSVTFEKSLVG